jgi:RNA methyltransferase, TrmH family
MGSFLRVGIEYLPLKDLVTKQKMPVEVYGTTLDGRNLYSEELKPGIIVIGNEANGIQPENLALVTKRLTIPSAPGVRAESLNAAMAAAIIAAEFFRRLK